MNQTIASTLAAFALCFVSQAPTLAQSGPAPYSQPAGRSIKAIGYQLGAGATKIDLRSTGLIPAVDGEARIEAKPAVTMVAVKISGLTSPAGLGAEFLTYVLWAVTPDGRAVNLGEVLFDRNGKGKLNATTELQSFSLFVTAEPYAAVRQPSEMLILENDVRKDTKGKVFIVSNYKLMTRSQYERLGNPLALSPDLINVPLEMYEARNAVEIAKSRQAAKYAPEIFSKAEASLRMAESALANTVARKEIISLARQTAQFSEDARSLAMQRMEQERIAIERADAVARARAAAEAKAAEEAQRQAELAEARRAQLRAEAAAREAETRAQAEIAAAKAKSEADALKAKEQAATAAAEAARRTAEDLRTNLLEQFNRIIATRDTIRGLVITIADVLFDTGKYSLRPPAREQLAKLSGIVLAHPGLHLAVEGHTDSTGSEELNQKLSQQRADAVRDYLVFQGLASSCIRAEGFGESRPIAGNGTAAGRQKNRRVELIVSGEIIGVPIDAPAKPDR